MADPRAGSGQAFRLAAIIIALVAVVGLLIIGITVLAGDGVPTPPPTRAPEPALRLAPNVAQAGMLVTVNGSGWSAGSMVLVRLEQAAGAAGASSPLASATAAADGSFSTQFIYPGDAAWNRLPGVWVVAWNPADVTQEARAVLVVVSPPDGTPAPTPVFTGWRGEYYNGTALAGAPLVVRDDPAVDFDWSDGAPAPGVPADGFSVRWTRELPFEEALYRFRLSMDDGARLYLDDRLVISDWQDGSLRELTADWQMGAGTHTLTVEYYENVGQAAVHLRWEKVDPYPDWKGEYWPNFLLSGSPVLVRNDANVDFNWGSGSPAPGVPVDNFSARWVRTLSFERGVYRFSVRASDGVRLYVDGRRVIDEWHVSSGERTYTLDMALQGSHTLRVDYFEGSGPALVSLSWQRTDA